MWRFLLITLIGDFWLYHKLGGIMIFEKKNHLHFFLQKQVFFQNLSEIYKNIKMVFDAQNFCVDPSGYEKLSKEG